MLRKSSGVRFVDPGVDARRAIGQTLYGGKQGLTRRRFGGVSRRVNPSSPLSETSSGRARFDERLGSPWIDTQGSPYALSV